MDWLNARQFVAKLRGTSDNIMNPNSPNPEGVRKPVLIGIGVIALVAGGILIVSLRGGKPEPVPEPVTESAPRARTARATPETPPAETPPVETLTPPPPAAATTPVKISNALPPGPEPTAATRALVSQLANIDLANLTPEAAAAWKQNLQALIQTGAAGLPAIQELLALNKDVNFEATPGAANLLGSSTLRLALLEALGQVGGPEAIALSAQALQSTMDPREIALLANSLDKQAPEQYREMAVAAARAALAQAGPGSANPRDVGPLFGVLTQYGGAGALSDLQQAAGGQWKYYAAIALSQMPDGAGIPALLQIASDANNPAIGARNAALPVLAPEARDNPEVQRFLIDQTQKGTIPTATWINIAAAITGERFHIGTMDAQTSPNVRTWHLNYGNQNYYAVPEPLSGPQLNQAASLINQLIAAKPGDAAVQILQDALNKAQNRSGTP